ncbi:nuclear autoantigenic sperm protein isoform X1 [Solea senegalensis]|uniref:Nuclear autoantigenic sperm protein isoform X1 n=1 Tax=Solea senegalensis TaxID=28829 RepID=A0AAV6SC61_SOLSE|nr:nuclear autoantigenic sperm protein isoform X1 [Solea senegalensis]KAG7514197.1 nuclear autoantigenic sperm protein isoform X1 [Solea senegalensis]
MPEETPAASSSGSVDEKPCSSSSSAAAAATDSIEVMEEAKKLIGTGNRHLVMGDVVSAVAVFQDACSMLAAKYGDTADECGEAFFLCGKALLELARMENSVLGNALEGVPEESEEEEQPPNSNIESASNLDEKTRDELRKQVYDAMAEQEKTEASDSKLESAEVKKENGVAKSPVKQVNGSEGGSNESSAQGAAVNGVEKIPGVHVSDEPAATSESPGKKTVTEEKQNGEPKPKDEEAKPEAEQDGEEPEDDDDDDDDDDDEEEEDGEKNGQNKEEDEVGNLQLAWEMLEVAKVIYKRKEGKDEQLMAAQTYLKLGEVSAESGNYPQALEDFQECLALQLKHLPPHSRLLAETHYHVATTLCYMDQYSQAIQHYNSSIKVIESRLAMLQEMIAAAEGADGAAEEKKELDELTQLLPDIKEKVEDAKESQRTAGSTSQAIQQTLGGASTSSAFLCENGGASSSSSAFATASQIPVKSSAKGSSSKAVSDISHLVRKKRKPEEESPVKDTDAKQAKQEASVNGSDDSSASNGNGVKEGKTQEAASQSASVQSSA